MKDMEAIEVTPEMASAGASELFTWNVSCDNREEIVTAVYRVMMEKYLNGAGGDGLRIVLKEQCLDFKVTDSEGRELTVYRRGPGFTVYK